MKTNILLFVCMLIGGLSHAQTTQYISLGDTHFDQLDFQSAIKYYEMALEDDIESIEIMRKIAMAHEQLGDMSASAGWLEKILNLEDSAPQDLLSLAEAYKRLERYDDAIAQYEQYAQKIPSDSRVQSHLKNPYYYLDLYGDSAKYHFHRMAFNSDQPAFGVCRFGDEYLFSSSGISKEFVDASDEDRNPFLDIYSCEKNEVNEFVAIQRVNGEVNSDYHDGPVCYDELQRVMYITRNNVKNGKPVLDEQGKINLKIYTSEYLDGEWQRVDELPFNSDEYSNGHPCVSPDGKRLYFVSNRPGGYGGTDIYVCTKFGNDWTEPQNVGDKVNTEGDEMFPQIDEEGNLFFASNGHAGLGGLDLFKSTREGFLFAEPTNLGYPISSPHDDFSLYYESGVSNGFFSSNREGQGNDNIYFFSTHVTPMQILAGFVEHHTGASLAGELLAVVDLTTGEQIEVMLDEKGAFEIEVLAGHEVSLRMKSGLYQPEELLRYQCPDPVEDPYNNVGVFSVEDRAFGQIAGLVDAQPHKSQKEWLEEQANAARQNLLTLKDQVNAMDQIDHDMTAKSEQDGSHLFMEGGPKSTILFPFNSSVITLAAGNKLDSIAEVLIAQPEITLQINTHCDSRGDSNFNMILSEDRAQAVRRYLRWKDVPKNQLKMNWHGEDQLVNHCDDITPCGTEEHRVNRRAELLMTNDLVMHK